MKAVNVDEVLKILWKYGEFIFVTDNKKYSDMVNEIANLKDVEQEPSEDCISRQAVIEYIEGSDAELGHSSENEFVCQDIKELPPVTPTQAPILDKIRAEIGGKYRVILKGTPKDDWAVRWNDCVDEILQIIDKYKAESEEA